MSPVSLGLGEQAHVEGVPHATGQRLARARFDRHSRLVAGTSRDTLVIVFLSFIYLFVHNDTMVVFLFCAGGGTVFVLVGMA